MASPVVPTAADDLGALPGTLVQALRHRAAASPGGTAYTFLRDGEGDADAITYGELDRRVRAIAAGLQSRRRRGERALVLTAPGLDTVAAFLGCLYAGVVAVPVPPPHRKRALPRLLAVARDCQTAVAVTTRQVLARVHRLAEENAELAELMRIEWLATDEISDQLADRWWEPEVTERTVAFLQYTSGSTGTPKGVVLTHGNLLHNQRLMRRAFEHTERSLVVGWLPMHHDMGLIGNVLHPLYMGIPCILMAPHHVLAKPWRWLAAISRYRATTSGGPNFAYELCVRGITPAQRASLDLNCWSVAFNGAEPVRAATLERFAAEFAPCGFRREAFFPCYGLAEATLFVSGGPRDAPPVVRALDRAALEGRQAVLAAGAEGSQALVGCGRLHPDQQVVIVDPDSRMPCAADQVGEIWIAGGSVAEGYWQRPEETAATFAVRLATGAGPFLRTGDLGFMREGELFVAGRLKDLVIIRGRNLHPHDLELTAEQSHPDLAPGGGAAFSVDVEGEEQLVVVHEIAGRPLADPAAAGAAIRRAIADRHEVVVHRIVLIPRGTLPRTTSGKVQRKACRARFLAGSLRVVWSSDAGEVAGPAPDPPRTALELMIAGIWGEVLAAERVGRHNEFLDLGGDSLRAAQICARLHEACGVQLSPAQLFESTTVASLAASLESAQGMAAPGESAALGAPMARPSPLPLSPVQERLWFLDQLVAGAPVYHIAVTVRLAGSLDVEALDAALTALTNRHEVLRTSFPLFGGRPVQSIAPPSAVRAPVTDLREVPAAERQAALRERLREQARRPFDLAAAPPVRWTLFRAGEDEHVLGFTCHHLVADGWSVATLLHELGLLYGAIRVGRAGTLEAPMQYADYALWQQRRRHDGELKRDLAYWRERLAGAPTVLDLPADRPRPAVQTYAGARQAFALSPELIDRLTAWGRTEGATLFMTVLAGLLALLHRYTRQTDLCIGAPVAGRSRVALERVVGCFVNTVALRVNLSGNPRVSDLLARVRAAVVEAQAHHEVPFEEVLEELRLPRALSHAPLFQLMFAMQPSGPRAPEFAGLEVSIDQVDTGTAQFDLALDLTVDARGARAAWEYNTDLFADPTIHRMTEHLLLVLDGMAGGPERRLSELPLLAERERRLITDGPTGARVVSPGGGIHELVEAQAARRPRAVALVDRDTRLTYEILNERANRLAHYLRRCGVGPEARVGICLNRSADLIVSVLAILKAGGAYVPLDPDHPEDRRAFVLADARVSVLVTCADLERRHSGMPCRRLCLDREADHIADEPAANPEALEMPDRLAYVIYTSGSTGRPKGVMVTHRTLANAFAAWQAVYRMAPDEIRWLQLASPAFDVWSADWIRALCSGGVLVLAPASAALDAAGVVALTRREDVTCMDLVPALVRPLMEEWRRTGADPGGLRLLVVGSDAWPVRDYEELRRACADRVRLLSCYGVTEATIDTAYFEGPVAASSFPERPVPLGRPFPNTRLHVLDAASGELLPVGVAGELAIAGAGAARGYCGQPALTAERFCPDPFSDEAGARLYRTGDRARWLPDGTFEFLGRVDHQIKLRGLRIEPTEIEAWLSRHPDVREAVVALRADGGRAGRLVAYVVPAPGRAAASSDLRDFLRSHLPEAMIPSAFVLLGARPLGANGKVDRLALPPVAEVAAPRDPEISPRTRLERTIAAVWHEVLAVERVGVHDNFFDLGGHSLLLARVRDGLRAQAGREVSMLDLFRYPTVASLAGALSGESDAAPGTSGEPGRERTPAGHGRRDQLFARRRRAGEASS